jgi:1-acyl-sn-glycerol-3-phosphate acyltransferase
MIDYCGAVPIDQGFGRDGIRAITERLHNGETVVVFPEGERTLDGGMNPLRPGVSLLLRDGDWPVMPVGIAGAFEAWPRGQTLPRPSPLFLPATDRGLGVVFGDCIAPEVYREWNRERLIAEFTLRIRNLHFEAESLRRNRKGESHAKTPRRKDIEWSGNALLMDVPPTPPQRLVN